MTGERSSQGLAQAIDGAIAAWAGAESTPHRKVCLTIAAGALGLGILGDALFNGADTGVNFPLWFSALALAYVFAMHQAGSRLDYGRILLLVLAIVLASMVGWRGSDALQVWSIFGSFACVSLAASMRPREGFRRLGLLELALAVAATSVALAAGLPRAIAALNPARWWKDRSHETTYAFGRALLITTPLVAAFGGLFIAADAVFESRANSLLIVDVSGLRSHVVQTGAMAWLASGVLWAGVAVKAPAVTLEVPEDRRLQTVEVGVIVGSLIALFFAFVVIQVQYLFGGEGPVEASLDLTYAEYARRGFFELVAAAGLLLPVLMALDWALARRQSTRLLFRVLAAVLLALLSVVMLSAFERMEVYKDAYGLTHLRIFVTAILVWLGVVFAWFAASVLAGRRNQFAAVTAITAVIALVVLNVLNPDAMIARTNTQRASEGKEFDAVYAASLGPEAAPVLIERLGSLSSADACIVARGLIERWGDGGGDLRGWTYAREQARDVVAENRVRLEAACRS